MTAHGVTAFLEAVRMGESGNSLKRRLLVSKADDFASWTDGEGYDALHHTMVLNNPEAVQMVLSEGYFRLPYMPESNLYSHFAAKLGFRTILGIILQFRPDDFRLVSGKIILPGEDDDVGWEDGTLRSPLDIAAEQGNIECVRTILNHCVLRLHPEAPAKDDVTLACLANCPSSLKLVLKDGPTLADVKSGIEVSLKKARPQCLDLLLQQNVRISSLFKHINFYHVLYTYSATFAKESFPLLPKMTSVLLKHGHAVNASKPPRTYPLYSLLSHSFCIDDYSNTQFYIKCMKMLLQEGADPCFDEVKDEVRQVKRGVNAAVGRHSFSSALHCLLETVEVFASFLDSRALAVRFVEECADILTQFNAHTNQVGRVGGSTSTLRGTILHQYAKCSVTIGVDDVIMKCILRHGADPNEKVNGNYAVNTYIDMLFEKLSLCQVLDTRRKYKDEIDAMFNICMYMSLASIRQCAAIFKRHHSREISEQVRPYVKYIENELDKRSRTIISLRRLSAWKVWILCGKKGSSVHALPVSAKIKTDILPIV